MSRIETESCFVIRCCGRDLYLIGSPRFKGVHFWSKELEVAIRQYSFKDYASCKNRIVELCEEFDWLKKWGLEPYVAVKLKEDLFI